MTIRIPSLIITLFAFGILGGSVPADAAEPIQNITAIDRTTQTVTAKDTRTGQTFQFKVADAKVLRTLTIGQAVYADFKTMKVSVEPDAAEPVLNIIMLRPAATAPVR